MSATRSLHEHDEEVHQAEPEVAKVAEPEAPAAVLSPEAPLTPAAVITLQKTVGNAVVARLIAGKSSAGGGGEDDDDELGRNRTVGTGARARIRWVGEPPLQRTPSARMKQPLIQRAGPDHGAAPAGAKDSDKSLSDLLLSHLQAPVDVSLETKPGGAGYVKCNKAGMKGQIKISPSKTADGDTTGGAGVGGKDQDDKKGLAITIAAEAKTQLQKSLTDQLSKAVSDLVKSMSGKDNALKMELFAKAKAEAKAAKSGGKPELSTKVGYDFGLDATLFGGVKVTFTVKLTLIGLKLKKGSKGFEFEANAFAAEASQKVAVKAKDAFTIRGVPFSLEGSVEWGAEFEPNWSKIAIDAAADVGGEAAAAAVLEFAAVAGPPLLAGLRPRERDRQRRRKGRAEREHPHCGPGRAQRGDRLRPGEYRLRRPRERPAGEAGARRRDGPDQAERDRERRGGRGSDGGAPREGPGRVRQDLRPVTPADLRRLRRRGQEDDPGLAQGALRPRDLDARGG